jgi:RimJ/RimL family protein N-acetyltransferase
MLTWIANFTKLIGQTVDLIPLEQAHYEELFLIAKNQSIWKFYAYDASDPLKFKEIFTATLAEKEKGNQFPFVIYSKCEHKIIGSTRFLDIQPKHKKLEIGTTWLHPDYWGTAANLECKLLLLTYCFESLQAVRVQLKTDERNLRSRKAIEKIGGHFEGILRNDMLRDNNTRRNSAYYSITDEEWPDKKIKLTELFHSKLTLEPMPK